MNEKFVHIVPIGFEEDRAVFGFIKLRVDKIYLMVDEKEDDWGEEARKHAEKIKNKLKQMAFDENNIITKNFDPTEFESCKNALISILDMEKESKVYLNVSTSTKLCAVAFALTALDYENVMLYYVVPDHYNIQAEGIPFSSGAKRIEVFSPNLNIKFADWEKQILNVLGKYNVTSLGELNRILASDDISKAMRAKLSYYVRKLEQKGYVVFQQGKSITLTERGKSYIYSPKDDAKLTISG